MANIVNDIVCVTGSRWGDVDPLLVNNALTVRLNFGRGSFVLFHGGNAGDERSVDLIAHQWALARGVSVLAFPYPSHLGKAGGQARNARMLQSALIASYSATVELIAFPSPVKSSSGTWGCVRAAEALNIKVTVHR